MCTRPLTIYNNSDYINPRALDVKRLVPCGHCLQCQQTKQSEYAIRGYYEYKECLDTGGYVYWDSLTYRPSKLPHRLGFPCFNKKHVQNFLKRLRKDLSDNHDLVDCFRYLVVSEYGDKEGRPHYHIMFFVHDPRLTLDLLHSLIIKHWRNWYGNTDFSKSPEGRILTSNAAINYVCKYLAKDDLRLGIFKKDLDEFLVSNGYDPCSTKTFNKYFTTWQLHSLGFGSYLFRCPDQHSYLENLECTMPTKSNPNKKYSLPLYYQRARVDGKCILGLYDVSKRPDPLDPGNPKADKRFWHGTQKLFAIQSRLFKENIEKKATELHNQLNSLYSLYEQSKNDFPRLVPFVSELLGSDKVSRYEFSSFVSSKLGDRTYLDLALYAHDVRYRFDEESQDPYDVVIHRVLDIPDIINPLKFGDYEEVRRNRLSYSRSCVRDIDFDLILDLHRTIMSAWSHVSTNDDEVKRLKRKIANGSKPIGYKYLYLL